MGVAERVRELIEPVLAQTNTEVVTIEHGHGLLRITIDHASGVDLDKCTEVSQVVSQLLDEADPISDAYTLEISSPGIERPLVTPAHFQRFVGSEINVKTKEAINGQRRFTGELKSADDSTIVVDDIEFSYEQIDKARLIAQWGSEFGEQKSDEKKGR